VPASAAAGIAISPATATAPPREIVSGASRSIPWMTSIWFPYCAIARRRSAASGRCETVSSTIGFSQSAYSPAGSRTAGIEAAMRRCSLQSLHASATRAIRKPTSGTAAKNAYVGWTSASAIEAAEIEST
jgi:hypothetical protein